MVKCTHWSWRFGTNPYPREARQPGKLSLSTTAVYHSWRRVWKPNDLEYSRMGNLPRRKKRKECFSSTYSNRVEAGFPFRLWWRKLLMCFLTWSRTSGRLKRRTCSKSLGRGCTMHWTVNRRVNCSELSRAPTSPSSRRKTKDLGRRKVWRGRRKSDRSFQGETHPSSKTKSARTCIWRNKKWSRC